ncbi:MAG: hypothetical protein WC796_00215 [Candidatus Pacearchaeota archaeon]|jgi:hypothetical protein
MTQELEEGARYRTRDGREALVGNHIDFREFDKVHPDNYYAGEVEGVNNPITRWQPDGTNCAGFTGLDLVERLS